MATTMFAPLAAALALAAAPAPVAHASIATPEVGHCVDAAPVYLLSQQVIGSVEVCLPA
jgi:hypothetical protein